MDIVERINLAIDRIRNGDASMRIPVDLSDPDMVLADAKQEIESLRSANAKLRTALEGMVGASTEKELKEMEATIRVLPASECDKAVMINVIHALLDRGPVLLNPGKGWA